MTNQPGPVVKSGRFFVPSAQRPQNAHFRHFRQKLEHRIIRTEKRPQIEKTAEITFFVRKMQKLWKKFWKLKINAYLCTGLRK